MLKFNKIKLNNKNFKDEQFKVYNHCILNNKDLNNIDLNLINNRKKKCSHIQNEIVKNINANFSKNIEYIKINKLKEELKLCYKECNNITNDN